MEKNHKYLLLLSNVSDRIINYLKRNQVEFTQFEFNSILDLSNVHFRERKNGMSAWKDCDNFIEGVLWEDHEFKPKTQKEKLHGMYIGGFSNRGWHKFRCKARVTKDDPRGIQTYSYISCDHCEHYSPRTLEGRKHILEVVRDEYQRETAKLNNKIGHLEEELKKQEGEAE